MRLRRDSQLPTTGPRKHRSRRPVGVDVQDAVVLSGWMFTYWRKSSIGRGQGGGGGGGEQREICKSRRMHVSSFVELLEPYRCGYLVLRRVWFWSVQIIAERFELRVVGISFEWTVLFSSTDEINPIIFTNRTSKRSCCGCGLWEKMWEAEDHVTAISSNCFVGGLDQISDLYGALRPDTYSVGLSI